MPHLKICCVAQALLFCAGQSMAAAASDPDQLGPLFAAGVDGSEPLASETIERARPIDAIDGVMLAGGVGDEVTLNLFADATHNAVVDRIDRSGPASFTWSGQLLNDKGERDEGRFVLAYEQGAVMGAVWTEAGETFEVRSDRFGRLWATQLDGDAFEPCATSDEHHVGGAEDPLVGLAAGSAGKSGTPCADDGSIIDVLVVYTPAARASMGGTNSALATVNAAIASTNTAYAASEVNTEVRLVYAGEINYNEGSSFGQDLNRFRGTSDGFMDEVHQLREQYGADMVALLNDNDGACGVAYLMTNLSLDFASSAFSVTDYSCAVGNLTFAHELGHNQGCAHDRDNAGSAVFSYSYGYRWVSTNGQQYRSVLSYAPGSRVPRMSNPEVNYIGAPTGVPVTQSDSAFNAQSINEVALTVASWRQSGENITPGFALQPLDLEIEAGQTAVFTTEVTGSDPILLRWLRDGQPLLDGGKISGATTDTLSIVDVSALDVGSYSLLAVNACGQVESAPATLAVTSACTGDVANDFGFAGADGQVSFGDFLFALTVLGPCPGGAPGCDFDLADDFGFAGADGQVSYGDFLFALTILGPCP